MLVESQGCPALTSQQLPALAAGSLFSRLPGDHTHDCSIQRHGAAARARRSGGESMPRHPGQGSGRVLPGRARRAPRPMVARRPSPMPPAATRMSMPSTTGGNWRVPSSAAMTLASSSIRRRACLRASCAARTTSTCPPPRHTCRCRRFLPRPAVTDRPSLAPAPGGSFFPAMRTAASADCRSPARRPGATLPAMFR